LELYTVLLLAVALGVDAFSVAVSIGLQGVRKLLILELSGVVALFHVFMPLIGLALGGTLGRVMGDTAAIIGALVLLLIGGGMIREVIKTNLPRPAAGARKPSLVPQNLPVFMGLWGMVAMAFSVSLDALSVGFGLGTTGVNLLFTVLAMGLAAGLMTAAGLLLGGYIGHKVEGQARLLGGLILVAVGIRMLLA